MTTTRTPRKRSRSTRGSRLPAEAGKSLGIFCMVSQLGSWAAWKALVKRVDSISRPTTQEEYEPDEPEQGTEAEPPVRERQASFAFEELADGDEAGE